MPGIVPGSGEGAELFSMAPSPTDYFAYAVTWTGHLLDERGRDDLSSRLLYLVEEVTINYYIWENRRLDQASV
jgi:hypothetical protein